MIWEDRRKPLSGPALHRWWYRCLTRAGVVDEGTTHGKKMHGARYTSGDRVLPRHRRHLRDSAAARPRGRQHHREHLRPGLARRPRGEAQEGLGRIAAENDSDRRPFDRIVPIEKAPITGNSGGGGSRTRVAFPTSPSPGEPSGPPGPCPAPSLAVPCRPGGRGALPGG